MKMKLQSILSSRLFKTLAGTFVVRVLSVGATFLCSVLLARTLGSENFGVYSYVLALVSILAMPAQAGMPTLVLRETAKAKALKDWARMKGIWLWSGSTIIAISLCIYIAALVLKNTLFFDALGTSTTQIFTLGLLMSLLVAMGNVRGAALRGLGFVIQGQLPEGLVKPLLFAVLIFITIILDVNILPVSAMALNLVAAAIAFIVGTWLVLKVKPKELKSVKAITHTRTWLITLMPLAMMTGMQTLSGQIDILMLGALATVSDVGIYKVVVSGAALAVFGLQVVSIVISPRLVTAFAKKDRLEIQRLASIGSLVSFLLTLPVVFIFGFGGTEMLRFIFGDEFSGGHQALFVITIGQAISAFFGSSISILTMSGNEKYVIKGMTISVFVNVGLNLFLIPMLGLSGAALSTSISIVVWNLYLWFAVRTQAGVDSTFIKLFLRKYL